MTQASAPGKCILFGEHAVVYGRPAIAIPLPGLRATARVSDLPSSPPARVRIEAPDIRVNGWIEEVPFNDPLRRVIELTLQETGPPPNGLHVDVRSKIPIASGLGSGAAVSVALVRAISRHLGAELTNERVSSLAFEVEKLHHGTPSGIDNTVVTYERAVYYAQESGPEPFQFSKALPLVIGDTGVGSPTREVVGLVRRAWQQEPEALESIFDQIGSLVGTAREALLSGRIRILGELMDRNQTLLEALDVSAEMLRALISAAKAAGALGAKLSGAGRGGIVIALPPGPQSGPIEAALRDAGAVWTYTAEVGA
jgi:mevalonate kinase